VFLEERKLPRLKKVLSKVRKWVGKNGLKLWIAKWKKIQSGELQATEDDKPLSFEEYEKNFILPQMGPFWTACCREANKKNFYAEVKAQTGVDLQ
jgi:hypothetical protein